MVRNLGPVYLPILLTMYGTGVAFIGAYRISREVHEENLRRLAEL